MAKKNKTTDEQVNETKKRESQKEKRKKALNKNEEVNIDELAEQIPEDEIWTYQVPGLKAPQVNKSYKGQNGKKAAFIIVLVIAICVSLYFSFQAIQKDVFKFEELAPHKYKLSQFTNNGSMKKVRLDKVMDVEYIPGDSNPETNFKFVEEKDNNITEIKEYAFNCDEVIQEIEIGPAVEKIDSKAFYSCWDLRQIKVDDDNPYYCDVDGILYTKDMKTLVSMPVNYNTYLREKNGYTEDIAADDAKYAEFVKTSKTYVVPSSVEKIDALGMNYNKMVNIYLPEGLKEIGTLAMFKSPNIEHIRSYTAKNVTSTSFTDEKSLGTVYESLPNGLVTIGSDAFTQDQALTYMYVPKSVTTIGHHAFWETCYKKDGEVVGVNKICVEKSEADFENVETGTHWMPQYDYMLFKKSVPVEYGAKRQ